MIIWKALQQIIISKKTHF